MTDHDFDWLVRNPSDKLRSVVRGRLDPLEMAAIAPSNGDGSWVFVPEVRDQLATYGYPGIGERIGPIGRRRTWAGPDDDEWMRQTPDRVLLFDSRPKPAKRFPVVMDWLRQWEGKNLCLLAIDTHGWPKGLQIGTYTWNVDDWAPVVASVMHPGGTLALMACYAGRGPGPGGDGGFADVARDALCALGLRDVRVIGHSSRGHTTANDDVRVFDGRGSPVGGLGGYDLVGKRSPLRPVFRRWLDVAGPRAGRHRMLQMEPQQIHTELAELAEVA